MRNRMLLPLLGMCLFLGLLVAWHFLAPPPSPGLNGPAHEAPRDGIASDPDPAREEPAPEPPLREEPAPEERTPAETPPRPDIVNDPASGRIWLRLVDADTGRAITDTDCRLMPVEYNAAAGMHFYTREAASTRRTDAHGLIDFPAGVGEAPGADEFHITEEGRASRLVVPVPQGWYPAGSLRDLAARVAELADQPNDRPVELRLRRLVDVEVVVRGPDGAPVPHAKLIVMPEVAGGSPPGEWLEAFRPDIDVGVDWSTYTDGIKRGARESEVRAVFNRKSLRGDHSADLDDFEDDIAYADASGIHRIQQVPPMRLGVIAWHAMYEPGRGSAEINETNSRVEVELDEGGRGELRLRVVYLAGDGGPAESCSIDLSETGPFGNEDMIEGPVRYHNYSFKLPDNRGDAEWEFVVTGLDAGYWHVGVDVVGRHHPRDGANAGITRIVPNRTTEFTLYVGPSSHATWIPVVRVAGQLLEACYVYCTGRGETAYTPLLVVYDADHEGAPIELPAGTYTFWLPALQPVTITLEPGEVRRDEFDIPAQWVEFSISARLAELMDKDMALDFTLRSRGFDSGFEPVMYWIAREFGPRRDLPNQLSPGDSLRWPVPAGDYTWELAGSERNLEGRISIDSETSLVHFDLYDLPGLATLEIHLQGFDPNQADVTLEDDFHRNHAVMGKWTGRREPAGPSIAFPPDPLDEDIVRLWEFPESARFIAFAPPGPGLIQVSGDVDGAERWGWFGVEFPGRLTVHADDLSADLATIHLEGPNTSYQFEAAAFHKNGLSSRRSSDQWKFPPGKVRLEVTRYATIHFFEKGRYGYEMQCAYATVELDLQGEDVTVNLSELEYEPYGVVDIVLRGRGSPEKALDAWWFRNDEMPELQLYHLDSRIRGNPRRVLGGHPSPEFRHGRQAAVRGMALPPGRYRLVPWDGAPAKHQRTFTVTPGGRHTVTVDTGE